MNSKPVTIAPPCLSGSAAGAGVLPEVGSFASIAGEIPEGNHPGASTAAYWEG